jgi:hypothetical protein
MSNLRGKRRGRVCGLSSAARADQKYEDRYEQNNAADLNQKKPPLSMEMPVEIIS